MRRLRRLTRLEDLGTSVLLQVQDNGRGIPSHRSVDTKSFGLLGMRQRVSLLGGDVHIDSREGEGDDDRAPTGGGGVTTVEKGGEYMSATMGSTAAVRIFGR
ncbi:MAG: hypothetical protein U0361_06220 [Nitrospiraceae bacterium]